MSDETPRIASRSTSSATRIASSIAVPPGRISSRRSFSTTTSTSTIPRISSMAAAASSARRLPSKWNGAVTTPMTTAPARRAISATSGAPPEPVPPPIPAVTNTRSAPAKNSDSSAAASSAAARPIAVSPPAPVPRSRDSPKRRRECARVAERACEGEGGGVRRGDGRAAVGDGWGPWWGGVASRRARAPARRCSE